MSTILSPCSVLGLRVQSGAKVSLSALEWRSELSRSICTGDPPSPDEATQPTGQDTRPAESSSDAPAHTRTQAGDMGHRGGEVTLQVTGAASPPPSQVLLDSVQTKDAAQLACICVS